MYDDYCREVTCPQLSPSSFRDSLPSVIASYDIPAAPRVEWGSGFLSARGIANARLRLRGLQNRFNFRESQARTTEPENQGERKGIFLYVIGPTGVGKSEILAQYEDKGAAQEPSSPEAKAKPSKMALIDELVEEHPVAGCSSGSTS
jgi:hypothetical protein